MRIFSNIELKTIFYVKMVKKSKKHSYNSVCDLDLLGPFGTNSLHLVEGGRAFYANVPDQFF
jgi:hypothetical protein